MACVACVSKKYDAIIKQHLAMCRKYFEYVTKNFHATSEEIEKAIDKPAYIKNILEIMNEKCAECPND